jgi:hypothetical protein
MLSVIVMRVILMGVIMLSVNKIGPCPYINGQPGMRETPTAVREGVGVIPLTSLGAGKVLVTMMLK